MTHFPDDPVIQAALELAVRAPSVHNSQPWRFRVGTRDIRLHADPRRRLTATDPDGRDLLISCGAALHHLRVALTALGWLPVAHRLPEPADPDHLATVEPLPRNAIHASVALATAIPRRRTDRRDYTSRAVPVRGLDELTRVAAAEGVALRVIGPGAARTRLVSTIAEADQHQRNDPSYVYELARWTGHRTVDGIPTSSPGYPDLPGRQFAAGRLHGVTAESERDAAGTLLILGTTADDRMSRLRVGEATSAVLLAATQMGLATCPLTQPLEVPATRESLRAEILDDLMVPQMVIRVGWAPEGPNPVPLTGRRRVSDVTDWVMP
jgi:nitroreductase